MTSPRFLRSPRIWFSRSRLILTSRARLTRRALIAWLSRSLTRTSLYHPHCMMRAMPTASLRSLLLICIFRAAFACRASMQITGSSILFSSRQEFHAREDGAPACSNRGERGAVSEPARHRRPAGTNGSPRCEDGAPTLPKPMTSGAKSDGRFGKQDFAYLPTQDVYRCPAGEKLAYRYTNEEDGKTLRRYWTTARPRCPLKSRCKTGPERRITPWDHAHVREAMQQRLDENPQAMRLRRETAEHPFGTLK